MRARRSGRTEVAPGRRGPVGRWRAVLAGVAVLGVTAAALLVVSGERAVSARSAGSDAVPVTASPVTAVPVTAVPVTASPVTASPVTASPAEPPGTVVRNDVVRLATDGQPVRANGGSIVKVGGVWLLYGMAYDGRPGGRDHYVMRVRVYASLDLAHWTLLAAPLVYDSETTPGPRVTWWGRPDVLYDGRTGRFVLLLERAVEGADARNVVSLYVAPTATGPFRHLGRHDITRLGGAAGDSAGGGRQGDTIGDTGLFVDDDGSAYLLAVGDDGATNRRNVRLRIVRLSADLTGVADVVHRCGGGNREAPSIVRHDGWYYLFASETRGWKSSATWWKRARTLAELPCQGGDDGRGWHRLTTDPVTPDSFNTQLASVVAVHGTHATGYLYLGDRWNQFEREIGGVGTSAWFPLAFAPDGTPRLHGAPQWRLDAARGTWSVAGAAGDPSG